MAAKIASLVTLVLSTTSFLTWGSFEAYKNQEYNSKMNKYEEWRKIFFEKNKSDNSETAICGVKENCEKYRSYLPQPYENKDWEALYKSLNANREEDKRNQKEVRLPDIKDFEKLKDYCYGEIKKSLDNGTDFNATGHSSGSNHDLCVLVIDE